MIKIGDMVRLIKHKKDDIGIVWNSTKHESWHVFTIKWIKSGGWSCWDISDVKYLLRDKELEIL